MLTLSLAAQAAQTATEATSMLEWAGIIVSLCALGWGIFKDIRSRRYSRALDTSDRALATLIAGCELYKRTHPDSREVDRFRGILRTMATYTGAERDKLAGAVSAIQDMLRGAGVIGDSVMSLDEDRIRQASEVASLAQLNRPDLFGKKAVVKPAVKKILPLGLLGIVLALWLTSCAVMSPCPTRLTEETIVDGNPPILVVRWPAGLSTNPDAYYTAEIEGRTQTAVPLTPFD